MLYHCVHPQSRPPEGNTKNFCLLRWGESGWITWKEEKKKTKQRETLQRSAGEESGQLGKEQAASYNNVTTPQRHLKQQQLQLLPDWQGERERDPPIRWPTICYIITYEIIHLFFISQPSRSTVHEKTNLLATSAGFLGLQPELRKSTLKD